MKTWQALSGRLSSALPRALGRLRLRQAVLDVLVALSLAFLVWLYARSRAQAVLDDVQVPVRVALSASDAAGWQLEVDGSGRIPVSFSGPPSRIRELRQQLQRGLVQVALSLSVPEGHQKDSTYHDRVRVEASSVPAPPGVQVVVPEGRNVLAVTLRRIVERHLPVHLDYAGDLRISNIKLEPATVVVRGPKEVLDRARQVATQPCTPVSPKDELSEEPQAHGQASLLSEIDGRPVQCKPDVVSFRFRLHPRQKVYELTGVPVQFLCPPGFAWRPHFPEAEAGKVNLKVVGPAGEETPVVLAFIDLTHGDLARGRNVEPVRLQLPKEFQLAQDTPRLMAFYLDALEGRGE